MKRISIKIPLNYRIIVFVTLATSWFSGISFFLLDTFFQVQGEFGIQKHPWQNFALTIHGGAAFLMMVWFGGIIATHVPMGWRTKRLRFWGITLIVFTSLQMLTAYGLYYMANETGRIATEWIHLIIGIALPFILTVHIVTGIRERNARKKKMTQR